MLKSPKLLIVGIDPGTTIGYSLLDLKGDVVNIGSSKLLDLSSLISAVIRFGRPVIVSCDVFPVPSFVKKFSVKTGARLVYPKSDLSVRDKLDLARDYKTRNLHESDSLASALFAFKQLRSLLKKLDLALRDKPVISSQVKDIVLRNRIPIKEAVDLVESYDGRITKPFIITKEVSDQSLQGKINFLQDRLSSKDKDLQFLKKKLFLLDHKLLIAQRDKRVLLKKFSELSEKEDLHLSQHKSSLSLLNKEVKEEKSLIQGLNNQLFGLNKFIGCLHDNVLLKRLRNLGSGEFNNNKVLNIQEGDILLVDDLDVRSQKVLAFLENKVEIVIFRKAGKKSQQLPFTLINAKDLQITESQFFAFVDKKQLDVEKSKLDVLSRIVEEYRSH